MGHLALSVDRFTAAIYPKFFNDYSFRFGLVLFSCVWVISIAATGATAVGVSSTITVEICLSRTCVSENVTKWFSGLCMVASIFSVAIYLLCVILLKLQYSRAKISSGNNNILEIRKRMRNKATKALALNSFIHFITYTLSSAGSYIVTIYISNPAAVGPYFATLFTVGGISGFIVYFTCQKKFRQGFRRSLRIFFNIEQNTITFLT